MSDATFRLALAQAPSDLDGRAARLAWLRDHLPDIADRGVDLVVLPELFACGYAIGDQLEASAEPQKGETKQMLAQIAQEFGLAIHCGYAEREGDVLYNSAICVAPNGETLGHHRKLAIPPGFERAHFSPGHGCTLFTYRGFRIATLICYDAEFPETVRHVAGLGADLVLVPTALGTAWGWVADTMLPTRAYENGMFLAYANGAGTQNGMDFLGRSFIAAPNGTELARAGAAPEILFADLDLAMVRAAQTRLPYLKDKQHLSLIK
jgi:5-aminopentanamidase